jgi:hypothetical protein
MNERSPREPSSHLPTAHRLIDTPPTLEPHHPSRRRKIKLKIMSCFSTAEKGRFLSRFATQSTTTSPQKHHVCTPLFTKHPSKTPEKQQNLLSHHVDFFYIK